MTIIPEYEYDIFISYRLKDDKYDNWVTEFVSNLKRELEATFRSSINVYFDTNPIDGILETHDVDESIKNKIRSIIFIPIISHTYCDQDSFAWAHEFRSFIDQASADKLGLKIKLSNGNYSSRVLPVIIHDLSSDEKMLCEKILGGQLRGIEFVYREPGVNRPLRSTEDNPHDNRSHTIYRNQINKLANSIKEILTAIKNNPVSIDVKNNSRLAEFGSDNKEKKHRTLIYSISVSFFILAALSAGYIIKKSHWPAEKISVEPKSVAVLPFTNVDKNPEIDRLCYALMEEILNQLFKIEGLSLPASYSSEHYGNSNLSLHEIAKRMKVQYVLIGNFRRIGDSIRVITYLINGKTEKIKWSPDPYTTSADDFLKIPVKIAQGVANQLEISIKPKVTETAGQLPTRSFDAYMLYIRANSDSLQGTEKSKNMLEEAIRIDPRFAEAYTSLAIYWMTTGMFTGYLPRQEVIRNVQPLLDTALKINQSSVLTHAVKGMFNLYYNRDFKTVKREYEIARGLDPSSVIISDWFSDYLIANGNFEESVRLAKKNFELNQGVISYWIGLALSYYFMDEKEESYKTIKAMYTTFPENDFSQLHVIRILSYLEKYDDVLRLSQDHSFEKSGFDTIPQFIAHTGISFYKTGDTTRADKNLKLLLEKAASSPVGSPKFYAAEMLTSMGKNDRALDLLEQSYDDFELEMFWLRVEPLFMPLHRIPKFEKLVKKIGYN